MALNLQMEYNRLMKRAPSNGPDVVKTLSESSPVRKSTLLQIAQIAARLFSKVVGTIDVMVKSEHHQLMANIRDGVPDAKKGLIEICKTVDC